MEEKGRNSVRWIIAKYASSSYYEQALGLITTFLRAKLLTPEFFGLWTLLKVIPKYNSSLHLGSRPLMRYLIPYYAAKQDHEKTAAIKNTGFLTSLAPSVLVAVLLLGLSFKESFGPEVRAGFLTMAAVVVLQCYYSNYIALLKALDRFSLVASLNYVKSTVVLILTIPLVYFFRIYGLYLSIVLTYVIMIGYLKSKYVLDVRARFTFSVFRDFIIKGFPIMLIGFSITLITTSDRFIVSHFIGNNELGFYGIAIMVVALLNKVPSATQQVLVPRLMGMLDRSSSEAMVSKYLLKPLINIAYLMPFLIGPIFFMFPVLVPLILPRYIQGIVPAQILAFGVYFLAMSESPRMIIIANNWQMRAALLLPLVLVVNIALSVFLVKQGLGLLGVAAASSISLLLLFLILFIFVAKKLEAKGKFWNNHVFGMTLPFPVMCIMVFGLHYLVPKFAANHYIAAIASTLLFSMSMLLLHKWASKKFVLLKEITFRGVGYRGDLSRALADCPDELAPDVERRS